MGNTVLSVDDDGCLFGHSFETMSDADHHLQIRVLNNF